MTRGEWDGFLRTSYSRPICEMKRLREQDNRVITALVLLICEAELQ